MTKKTKTSTRVHASNARRVNKALTHLAAATKIIARGGEISDNTLDQFVGMAVESMLDGDAKYILSELIDGGAVKLSSEVKRAANNYESAAEEVLTEIAGGDAASEAVSDDAPFLMFMTQERSGVGINDGGLDHIEGLDLKLLGDKLNNHPSLGSAYARLRNAIEENAFELIDDAITELVDNANSATGEALDDREEQEKDPDGSTADAVARFLGDQITYTYTSLKDFAEDNRDRVNEDVAEAISDAFEAGHSENAIYKAIQDVGEIEWVRGHRSQRGFALSDSGEAELTVSASDIVIRNPYGDDTTVAAIVKMLKEFNEVDVKFDYEMDDDEITDNRSLDGYWNWDVDPGKLRRKLRI